MMERAARWRRGFVASSLAASALGWSGCEPLDLELFPVAPADASAPPLIEVPDASPGSAVADAGSAGVLDAGGKDGDAGDGGSSLPQPPSPCVLGARACEACVRADACPAGQVCHPLTGDCVPPCASSTPQCPGALLCSSLDVCVECERDDQCTRDDDETRCALGGECVECLTNADCTDDPLERPVCLPDGECGCASNADCSGGAICEIDERHCEIED